MLKKTHANKKIKNAKRLPLPIFKSKGYIYWKNIVKPDFKPKRSEWKTIETDIMKMRLQKEARVKFHFIKLNELIAKH